VAELNVLDGLEWSFQALKPLETIKRAITTQYVDGRITFLGRFWTFPILFTIALNLPIFRTLGLDIDHDVVSMGFILLSTSIKQALGGFLLWLILRIVRVEANLSVVLGCYTIYVIYSPFIALLELPANYIKYNMLINLKSQHLSILDSLGFWLDGRAAVPMNDIVKSTWFMTVAVVVDFISPIVNLIEIVIVSEGVVQFMNGDRFRTYCAVTIGSFIFVIPAYMSTFVQWAVVLSAAK
jgi:hypothetical protein